MLYFHSWSGGKDSTASVILDHIHNLPPSKIIFSEVMFDKKRGISGELPEHIDFVKNKAISKFKEWGYDVEILHSDIDYLDMFYHVITRSRVPERNGKYSGFLIGGMCKANSQAKFKPINKFYSQLKGQDFIQYVSIAIDEPERLKRLKGTNRISLLEKYGYTEKMAYDLCKEYDLLSPIYEFSKRGGCWFCPNASIREFAYLKQNHIELWNELEKLSHVPVSNLSSWAFKYDMTFEDVSREVDCIIKNQEFEASQLKLF